MVETYVDESGQRYVWDGYGFAPVAPDFDAERSAFASGVVGSTQDVIAGAEQLYAWITGDDAALADLQRSVELRRAGESAIGRNAPLSQLGGQILPYAAAAATGAGVGGAVGAPIIGATAADAALAGLSYGSPQERLIGAGVAGVAGAGAGALSRLGRPRTGSMAERVQARADAAERAGGLPGAEAGGISSGAAMTADVMQEGIDPGAATLGQEVFRRMRGYAVQMDPGELARTKRARDLADRHGIRMSPAMTSGSRRLQQFEEGMMSDPWSAPAAFRVRDAYMDELQERTKAFLYPIPRTGRPGEYVTDEAGRWKARPGPLNEEFAARARDDIGAGYREIADKTPSVEAETIRTVAEEQLKGGKDWANFLQKDRDTFEQLLDNVIAQSDEGQLTGQAAWHLQQTMAEGAARQFNKGNFEQGLARQAISDAIEDILVENAKGAIDPDKLNLLRKRYRVLQALTKGRNPAIDRGGLYLGRGYNEMRAAFPRELGELRGFDEPELRELDRLLDVFYVGNTLFRDYVGNSGTATRLAVRDLTSPVNSAHGVARRVASELYYGLGQRSSAQ